MADEHNFNPSSYWDHKSGLMLWCYFFPRFFQTQSVTKGPDGKLTLDTTSGQITDVDCLIWAIGRVPNVDIGLDKVVS